MSLSELSLIAIVALIILKPEDIRSVALFIRDMISYFSKLKDEIWYMIDNNLDDTKSDSLKTTQDYDDLNLYLEKIIKMNGKYEGNYDLVSVKLYYHKLLINNKFKKQENI